MSDKISVKDAQAEINGLLVAEICRDFGINFRDVYPRHILARGVGPEQAFIGLAIKRGHLALPAVQPDAAAIRAAVLREAIAALIRKEQGQLLSDYDVHPEIFKNDPETGQAVWDLTDAILALIDNTGKEVMPDAPKFSQPADIGPGDQAVAGAAPVTVEDALVDRLARLICLSAHGDTNPSPVPDELMPRQWMILRDRYYRMAHAALAALNTGKETK